MTAPNWDALGILHFGIPNAPHVLPSIMARKRVAPEGSQQTALRLDPDLIERADALLPRISARLGKAATRADVLRLALVRGLKELERAAD
jgi:hypothetical protein